MLGVSADDFGDGARDSESHGHIPGTKLRGRAPLWWALQPGGDVGSIGPAPDRAVRCSRLLVGADRSRATRWCVGSRDHRSCTGRARSAMMMLTGRGLGPHSSLSCCSRSPCDTSCSTSRQARATPTIRSTAWQSGSPRGRGRHDLRRRVQPCRLPRRRRDGHVRLADAVGLPNGPDVRQARRWCHLPRAERRRQMNTPNRR